VTGRRRKRGNRFGTDRQR